MFVPHCTRQSLYALFDSSASYWSFYKDTLMYVGLCIKYTSFVWNFNLERKLCEKKLVRFVDWRKVNSLFNGWGAVGEELYLDTNLCKFGCA